MYGVRTIRVYELINYLPSVLKYVYDIRRRQLYFLQKGLNL